MSKKIVIKADLIGDKCRSEILAIVSKNQGIKSMEVDAEKCMLTVVGTVDPVRIVQKLKKKCFEAAIVSVEDDKPKEKKEKDPCKEACEKLCKEKCDKIACCKECKDKCEKECKDKCEKACNEWLGKGCCDQCKPSTSAAAAAAGCYEYDPCAAVPSYYPYHGGYYYGGAAGRPYPYYGCYEFEERSLEGGCTIQ